MKQTSLKASHYENMGLNLLDAETMHNTQGGIALNHEHSFLKDHCLHLVEGLLGAAALSLLIYNRTSIWAYGKRLFSPHLHGAGPAMPNASKENIDVDAPKKNDSSGEIQNPVYSPLNGASSQLSTEKQMQVDPLNLNSPKMPLLGSPKTKINNVQVGDDYQKVYLGIVGEGSYFNGKIIYNIKVGQTKNLKQQPYVRVDDIISNDLMNPHERGEAIKKRYHSLIPENKDVVAPNFHDKASAKPEKPFIKSLGGCTTSFPSQEIKYNGYEPPGYDTPNEPIVSSARHIPGVPYSHQPYWGCINTPPEGIDYLFNPKQEKDTFVRIGGYKPKFIGESKRLESLYASVDEFIKEEYLNEHGQVDANKIPKDVMQQMGNKYKEVENLEKTDYKKRINEKVQKNHAESY